MTFVPTLAPRASRTTTRSTSSRSTSNTQSSSRTGTTGTISSSSSTYPNTTSTSSSSSSRVVLSTGARVGIGFGIAFFLLLCIILFSYLKRRYQRAREIVGYKPALSAPGGDLPPPPRLDVAYPNTQYPISAPARPSSYYSPAYAIPYETSASAAVMTTLNAPAGDSSLSNPQPGRQLPALHADIARHQDELERRKRSLDEAQEPQDTPPKYSF
ncbi:hypothetical protein DFJ58DRAFT_725776 [Suillus subalutaceus]|uniref:uncharacterized protein n=1 Tax=Suillus subalutaceus TaxID=48586 RepID=UPI001B878E36|nr:uncharacterized protein DFJ58DRAFT_725776 [Suillus subalutaceus]KAG1861606.1 hypothetical protein DFJ58DRAFT_725776 [Suillus subalutaceus]